MTCITFRVDLIFALTVGLIGIKLVTDISQVDDLRLFDETLYLIQGLELPEKGLPEPQWGPLYAVWYYLLSQIQSHPIALHTLNQQILFIATAIALYFCLRSLGTKPAIAFIATCIFLCSRIISVHPRQTLLALLVFLVGLIIAIRVASPWTIATISGLKTTSYFSSQVFQIRIKFLSVMATIDLIMALIRPEYFLSCFFLWFVLGIMILQLIDQGVPLKSRLHRSTTQSITGHPAGSRSSAAESATPLSSSQIAIFIYPLIALILSIMLLAIFGNPLSGGRSWFAFSQHFALNWSNWTGFEYNSWDHHDSIVTGVFGDADNLPAAIRANPLAFARHVLANVNYYINQSITLLLVGFEQYGFSAVVVNKLMIAEICLAVFVITQILRQFDHLLHTMKQWHELTIGWSLFWTVIAIELAVVPSCILIYPREHYLIVQSGILLGAIAALYSHTASSVVFFPSSLLQLNSTRGTIILGIAGLVFIPNLAFGWCLSPNLCLVPRNANRVNLNHRQTVDFLQSLQIEQPVNLLDADGGHAVYAGDHYNWVIPWDKYDDVSIDSFLSNYTNSIILVTPTLLTHPRFINDPSFHHMLDDPQDRGFVQRVIPNTPFSALIQSELLLPDS